MTRGKVEKSGEVIYNRGVKKEVDAAIEKQPKLNLKLTWKAVAKKQKSLMMAMIVLLVMSVALLIFSLATLRPQGTVVIVGYGDVYGEMAGLSGGYRRDSWLNMLAFPILAIVFGLVHNIIALRAYRKYGKEMAFLIVYATMMLVVGAFVILIRLLGEG